jgi:hypothetical protein
MGRYFNLEQETKAISRSAVAVVKSDSTVLPESALYVGTGGDLVVDMANGETNVTFKGVASGAFLPIVVVKVKAATTAADILAIN